MANPNPTSGALKFGAVIEAVLSLIKHRGYHRNADNAGYGEPGFAHAGPELLAEAEADLESLRDGLRELVEAAQGTTEWFSSRADISPMKHPSQPIHKLRAALDKVLKP